MIHRSELRCVNCGGDSYAILCIVCNKKMEINISQSKNPFPWGVIVGFVIGFLILAVMR